MQPNASEVFFRVQRKSGAPRYLDDILKGFCKPLLLLFGDQDPWVVPQRGRRIKELYPDADLRFIPSGHCPHDDTPEITNAELIDWLSTTTMHNMDLKCASKQDCRSERAFLIGGTVLLHPVLPSRIMWHPCDMQCAC
eukprot:365942-Chlamydomonas_euryale.AAC.12